MMFLASYDPTAGATAVGDSAAHLVGSVVVPVFASVVGIFVLLWAVKFITRMITGSAHGYGGGDGTWNDGEGYHGWSRSNVDFGQDNIDEWFDEGDRGFSEEEYGDTGRDGR